MSQNIICLQRSRDQTHGRVLWGLAHLSKHTLGEGRSYTTLTTHDGLPPGSVCGNCLSHMAVGGEVLGVPLGFDILDVQCWHTSLAITGDPLDPSSV